MLKWFRNLSEQTSAGQIRSEIDNLLQACFLAEADIRMTGKVSGIQQQAVIKHQQRLCSDLMNGPIPLSRARQEILEPALASPKLSEGMRVAILHVVENVSLKRKD